MAGKVRDMHSLALLVMSIHFEFLKNFIKGRLAAMKGDVVPFDSSGKANKI